MERRDGAYIKKQRLQAIAKMIAVTFPDGSSVEKISDAIQFKMGLRKETAIEYIRTVVNVKNWTLGIDGVIRP